MSWTKHSCSYEPLYKVWSSMKQRCLNQKCNKYTIYGGRGITICNEWKNDYVEFRKWALSNGYKPGLSIDRIDNDSGYRPDNCRWVDRFVQQNNMRRNHYLTYNGETHSISEWARILGLSKNCISDRVQKGLEIERILTSEKYNTWSFRDKTKGGMKK